MQLEILRQMRLLCAWWAEGVSRSQYLAGKKCERLRVWVMAEWVLLDLEAAPGMRGR